MESKYKYAAADLEQFALLPQRVSIHPFLSAAHHRHAPSVPLNEQNTDLVKQSGCSKWAEF